MEYWLVNGTVFDGVNAEPQQIDIKVKDGKIVETGKYSGGEKIDLSGMKVFPGLVEAHCHLGLAGYAVKYEGHDYNEKNDVTTPELNACDGFNPFDQSIANARRGGVTTVGTGPGSSNVIGGAFMAVKTYGTRVDDMIVKPKIAIKCAFEHCVPVIVPFFTPCIVDFSVLSLFNKCNNSGVRIGKILINIIACRSRQCQYS